MVVRNIIRIDEEKCTGCGQCVTSCAEGALEIVNGKAKVVRDSFCDGLGACIGVCPEGALTIEKRDVEEFDEEAVKAHLSLRRKNETAATKFACPSSIPVTIEKATLGHPHHGTAKAAKLGHWPIQLKLVPENAPFLRGKDLVVLADCTAVAYGELQDRFIDGNAVVMCCPKFDDIGPYESKLKAMIKSAGIKSITVAHMEVPCCFGLHRLLEMVLTETRSGIPYREVIIGIKGDIKN